tara:strand:- start:12851 stop:13057 length:207 start_codon:yes stop_codon:yes gene_type:complete
MKKFKDIRKLEEAPLIQSEIGAIQSMSSRLEKELSKQSSKRRVQLLTQVGKLLGVRVTQMPNGKIEIR